MNDCTMKKFAQQKLNSHFNSFQDETYQGDVIRVMPSKSDIPLIKRAVYDKKRDIFELVFKFVSPGETKRILQDNVCFIEDIFGKLVGVQVLNMKSNSIESVQFKLQKTIEQIDSAVVDLRFKTVADKNIEKRKLTFINDFIVNDISRCSSVYEEPPKSKGVVSTAYNAFKGILNQ